MTTQLKEFQDFGGFVQFQVLNEDKNTGHMKVRGRFQMADTENANGRVYTSSLWEKQLNDPRVLEPLTTRRMLGETEHPESGTTHLSRVSHLVTKLERKGNEIIGEAEILNTPSGRILQELFRSKVAVGISSRGKGTSHLRNGIEYVDEDNFLVETWDFVHKPSTGGAFPQLVESVLTGPYSKGAEMDEKLKELKRLEVRAQDLLEATSKTGSTDEEIRSWFMESTELSANAESIISSISDEDKEEHGDYLETVADQIHQAKSAALSRLDKFHESRNSDVDRRAENARAGIVEGVTQITETSDTKDTPTENPLVNQLQALVQELQESRDYYRTRLDESLAVLEADEDELTQRYVAAKKLGEELLTRLDKRENALSELTQRYESLEERYQAAVELVAGITERQDRGRIVKLVREAIEMHPQLQAFHKSLLSCKTEEELEQRLDEIREALNLPVQDKEEAMIGQVSITAAKDDDAMQTEDEDTSTQHEEDDDELPLGERSQLPGAGESINEDEDAILVGESDSLLEHHADRGVSSVHRLLKKRSGWH